jgi:hypothetical protein
MLMPSRPMPTPAILELAFWEAIKRCVQDEDCPVSLEMCGSDDKGGIVFDNRIPDELWLYMTAALNDLAEAAGV